MDTKKRILTTDIIEQYKEHLISEGKNEATVEKYYRDVKVFLEFTGNNEIVKDTIISYKSKLENNYTARYINSILSSINGLFIFLGWYDLRMKMVNAQQQIDSDKAKKNNTCRDFSPKIAKIITREVEKTNFIHINKTVSQGIVDKIIKSMIDALYDDGYVWIANFGILKMYEKTSEQNNRLNPKTKKANDNQPKSFARITFKKSKSSYNNKNGSEKTYSPDRMYGTRKSSSEIIIRKCFNAEMANIISKEIKEAYYSHINKATANEIVRIITREIKDALDKNGCVRIMNLGKFEKRDTSPKNRINPNTGCKYEKKQGTFNIVFTPSLKLKGYYQYD